VSVRLKKWRGEIEKIIGDSEFTYLSDTPIEALFRDYEEIACLKPGELNINDSEKKGMRVAVLYRVRFQCNTYFIVEVFYGNYSNFYIPLKLARMLYGEGLEGVKHGYIKLTTFK
jgi:hypothetical protein